MAFTVGMSTTSVIDTEITEELKQEFIVAYTQANVTDQFVQFNRQIGAKSIAFPKFAALSAATTPLTEDVDPDSSAMSDSEIILTPAEYGNVVTLTSLADLQTGGRTAMAAMQVIAQNMALTMDVLAVRALEGTTNTSTVGTGLAGDVMSGTQMNKMYNKLARTNIPKHPVTGTYVMLAHDDVIHDIRIGTGAGTWQDLAKYADSVEPLNNEVGMYNGFRIVRNNNCLLTADAGGSPQLVDSYKSTFLGFNALGKAESQVPEIRVTGPFDKLGRFVNIGWYAVTDYGLIDTDAVWQSISSSSVGNNAA